MPPSDDHENARRSLQQFLYAVSHDLQEPFRKVRTFSQRLAAKLQGQLDEPAQGDLDRILNAAQRGQGMIEGLLILSRLDTNDSGASKVDLNETLATVCEELREKIAASETVVSVEPLPVLQANADQMKLLFACLLDNAIKFRREDKTPLVRVSAKDSQAESEACIVVEDNGIGLEQQYADRVFTVFQRLHPRDVYPGLGLGLAYCHTIVALHNGTINYESPAGGGTRFIVTLPTTTTSARCQ